VSSAPPRVSVIVPTRDRPRWVARAVGSALAQTTPPAEVVVVDDGSREPPRLPDDPRVRLVRRDTPGGVSAARNAGIRAARGELVTFLDDDDRLRPQMLAVSLAALERSASSSPVAVHSAVAVTTPDGDVREVRVPPSRRRGEHYALEPIEADRSYHAKQTLVVPRQVLLDVGGFDETFRSRVTTELFLRLNPVCAIDGIADVTYELTAHPGPRLSRDPALREDSFRQLIATHRELFAAHPAGHARLLREHARSCLEEGRRWSAARATLAAARHDPRATLAAAGRTLGGLGRGTPT
jgi:glycosyltransferase involved in cell wall biosynthesis